MTSASEPELEPVVIDTMLAGALFARPDHPLVGRYRAHLLGRPLVLAFVTVAELRYGAYKAKWGDKRIAALEQRFTEVSVVMPDNDLVEVCARLRTQCEMLGHPLHAKLHDSDRWIAATALRYGLALVSDDGIFADVPGLILRREPA
jgi:predicted nucleic acid-binding protein